jgi:hypothetical protein
MKKHIPALALVATLAVTGVAQALPGPLEESGALSTTLLPNPFSTHFDRGECLFPGFVPPTAGDEVGEARYRESDAGRLELRVRGEELTNTFINNITIGPCQVTSPITRAAAADGDPFKVFITGPEFQGYVQDSAGNDATVPALAGRMELRGRSDKPDLGVVVPDLDTSPGGHLVQLVGPQGFVEQSGVIAAG